MEKGKRIAICDRCGFVRQRAKKGKTFIACPDEACGGIMRVRTMSELGDAALRKMGLSAPKMLAKAFAVVASAMWAIR